MGVGIITYDSTWTPKRRRAALESRRVALESYRYHCWAVEFSNAQKVEVWKKYKQRVKWRARYKNEKHRDKPFTQLSVGQPDEGQLHECHVTLSIGDFELLGSGPELFITDSFFGSYAEIVESKAHCGEFAYAAAAEVIERNRKYRPYRGSWASGWNSEQG